MKDWPVSLRLSAASVELAESIYRARCQTYGPALPIRFDDCEHSMRRPYIELAQAILSALGERLGPEPSTYLPMPTAAPALLRVVPKP